MAQKKMPKKAANNDLEVGSGINTTILDKTVNLLGLIAIKGESQIEKILTLTAAGFTPSEIASLLVLHQIRLA